MELITSLHENVACMVGFNISQAIVLGSPQARPAIIESKGPLTRLGIPSLLLLK